MSSGETERNIARDRALLMMDARTTEQEGGYLLNAAMGTLEDRDAQCRYYEALIRHAWQEVFPDRPFRDYQDAMHYLKWAAREKR